MGNIEVESRYIVQNHDVLNNFIEQYANFVSEKQQKDVYYDTNDASLFKKGVFTGQA